MDFGASQRQPLLGHACGEAATRCEADEVRAWTTPILDAATPTLLKFIRQRLAPAPDASEEFPPGSAPASG